MLLGKSILDSLWQEPNALAPMLIMLFDILTFVNREQLAKAEFSIVMTLSGIFKLIKFLQLLKARAPILVTVLEIFTLVDTYKSEP